MLLKEVADVIMGVLANREKNEKGESSYLLFSLKNYDEKNEYEKLITDKKLDNKLSKKGDLLFKLLSPNRIIYVDESIEGLLIPSQFCIIRANNISPIVLKWYLEKRKRSRGDRTKNNRFNYEIYKSIKHKRNKNS